MKRKNKLLISTIIGAGIIAGGVVTAKNFALNSYDNKIKETGIVSEISSEFIYQDGSLFIESNAVDKDNFKWKVLSKVKVDTDGETALSLTTKVFAIDSNTAREYASWLDAKNSSLNMIADSVITRNSLRVDIRSKPMKFQSETGTINVPELAAIYDLKNKVNPVLVIAALGNISVLNKDSGGVALFVTPRLKYVNLGHDQASYALKVSAVKVGILEVSKNTTVELLVSPKNDNRLDLTINLTSALMGGLQSLTVDSEVRNITEVQLINLAGLFSNGWNGDTNSKAENLNDLFDYAKNGGEILVNVSGKSVDDVLLNIDANLSFQDVGREFITPNNAFSILDYAKFDANVALPFNLASELIGPEWTANLIRDGLLLLVGEQVKSEIYISNMTAEINGSAFTL